MNIDVSGLIEVRRMNTGAVATLDVLLGLGLFLFLRNFINLILDNHIRVYLLRVISDTLTNVIKAKLGISRVSLNTSRISSSFIWILTFQSREEIIHHDSLCSQIIEKLLLRLLLLWHFRGGSLN